ncbi:Methyl-CpG DNA binding [Dillenia turbinata]|uniref:Methyl-CpG DNA binding n=1 Tax=Dillenia turbinata TaxID=194707 RepID=A0AAN8Z974_9MAGN
MYLVLKMESYGSQNPNASIPPRAHQYVDLTTLDWDIPQEVAGTTTDLPVDDYISNPCISINSVFSSGGGDAALRSTFNDLSNLDTVVPHNVAGTTSNLCMDDHNSTRPVFLGGSSGGLARPTLNDLSNWDGHDIYGNPFSHLSSAVAVGETSRRMLKDVTEAVISELSANNYVFDDGFSSSSSDSSVNLPAQFPAEPVQATTGKGPIRKTKHRAKTYQPPEWLPVGWFFIRTERTTPNRTKTQVDVIFISPKGVRHRSKQDVEKHIQKCPDDHIGDPNVISRETEKTIQLFVLGCRGKSRIIAHSDCKGSRVERLLAEMKP